jgi:RNA polymerase sigma-70 factor (ECF subfamily)
MDPAPAGQGGDVESTSQIALAAPAGVPMTAVTIDALYTAHADYVWLTLRRLGVAEADVPDVAHDVFLTAHRRLTSYDASRPARPWLFGLALRLAANHRRARRRRREADVEAPEIVDGSATPDARVAQRQAQALVFAALDELPDEQRAVFVLHELEGQAAPQIAADLEVPLATVYSRLRLGRERFARAARRRSGKDLP